MKVVYISSTITDGGRLETAEEREPNVLIAWELALCLMELGIAAICTHTGELACEKIGKTLPWETYIAADLAIISRCDAVFRIPGRSKGADAEVRHAEDEGIPVFTDINELLMWAKS